MKQLIRTALIYLCLSASAPANELDDLLNASDVMLGQIDQSIAYVGWSMTNTQQGMIAANGLYQDGLISESQLNDYNSALVSFAAFDPYGSSQVFLLDQADEEILNMNEAVDSFTDVVTEMTTVLQVNEMVVEAEEAGVGDPAAAQEVVDFVNEREDSGITLQITESQVETFNQSVEDINDSQGNAAAFIAVASNEEATEFLDSQAVDVNDSFDNPDIGVSFDRSSGEVAVAWDSVSSAGQISSVFVNGQTFGIDAYSTSTEVLTGGYESQLYLTGPTNLGYDCFFTGQNCDYSEGTGIEP